jgi:hypothetical protein
MSELKKLVKRPYDRHERFKDIVTLIRSAIENAGYTASYEDIEWAWLHYCTVWSLSPDMPCSDEALVEVMTRILMEEDKEYSTQAQFPEGRIITIDP